MTGPLLPGAATALLAICVDRLLGEPPRWHPLVGFGWLATQLEGALNAATRPNRQLRLPGAPAVVGLVGFPITLLAALPRHRLLDAACSGPVGRDGLTTRGGSSAAYRSFEVI